MVEPYDEALDRVTEALAAAIRLQHDDNAGAVVTRWLGLVEFMTPDGGRKIMSLLDPDMTTTWDCDGMAWNWLNASKEDE